MGGQLPWPLVTSRQPAKEEPSARPRPATRPPLLVCSWQCWQLAGSRDYIKNRFGVLASAAETE